MRTVPLGRSDLRVSRLSFGTAWIGPRGLYMPPEEGAELLCQALNLGITFWDTSDDYGTHPHVARALAQVPRAEVVLCSKTTEPEGAVERILDELGTDYLDVLLIHCVGLSWIEPARQALQVLRPDREKGRLRALGFSTHSAAVARQAAAWPEVEVLMLPINQAGVCTRDSGFEDGGVEDMLAAAQAAWQAGKGVVAMKVYGCGTLAQDAPAALSFAAGLPYVHSLCIGMDSLEQIQSNVALVEESP
jgi:aryl-alcohol dehydrogenase-like predicted oxidoreductase